MWHQDSAVQHGMAWYVVVWSSGGSEETSCTMGPSPSANPTLTPQEVALLRKHCLCPAMPCHAMGCDSAWCCNEYKMRPHAILNTIFVSTSAVVLLRRFKISCSIVSSCIVICRMVKTMPDLLHDVMLCHSTCCYT